MIKRLYGLSKVEYPLNAFKKLDAFKLFLIDTGLLKKMAGLDNSVILLQENYQFKGPLTENNPKVAIRYSRRPLKKDGKIMNISLYLVNKTFDLIG